MMARIALWASAIFILIIVASCNLPKNGHGLIGGGKACKRDCGHIYEVTPHGRRPV